MRTACLCVLCLLFFHCYGQNKKIPGFLKGDFRLSLKLPYFNHLSLHPAKQFRESRFGFIGEGLGVAYSFEEKRFMEMSFSLAGTSQTPFPVPNDKEYTKSLVTSFFSITDNLVKNRFSIGYGLSYSSNRWIEWIRDLSTMATVRRTEYANKTLGVLVNSYYRLGKTANVGVIYRPSLYRIDSGLDFLYEHLLSLEFAWRFRLFTHQRKNQTGY